MNNTWSIVMYLSFIYLRSQLMSCISHRIQTSTDACYDKRTFYRLAGQGTYRIGALHYVLRQTLHHKLTHAWKVMGLNPDYILKSFLLYDINNSEISTAILSLKFKYLQDLQHSMKDSVWYQKHAWNTDGHG